MPEDTVTQESPEAPSSPPQPPPEENEGDETEDITRDLAELEALFATSAESPPTPSPEAAENNRRSGSSLLETPYGSDTVSGEPEDEALDFSDDECAHLPGLDDQEDDPKTPSLPAQTKITKSDTVSVGSIASRVRLPRSWRSAGSLMLPIAVRVLTLLDRPFRHMSMRTKALIGYVAWATLGVSAITWLVALFVGPAGAK